MKEINRAKEQKARQVIAISILLRRQRAQRLASLRIAGLRETRRIISDNNRAVINVSTGAIEQTHAYHPYCTPSTTGQPYKFGSKELTTANGLNEYDRCLSISYPI